MPAAQNIANSNLFVRYYNASGMGYVQEGGQKDNQPSAYSWRTTTTTRYYAPNFEREVVGRKTSDYTYIQSPNGLVAAIKTNGTQHDAMLIPTDHLGSIIGVWNASGTLLEEHRYSAWGLRTSSTANPRLRRGFTGHEHLPQLGLIDMQARLYDPHLGRFLAPDPYVQAPENPMNYNRYAYCFNNPLKYTDPTGCFTEEEFREIMNEMHRLLDEANRMDQQLCVSFDGFGGGASGFGSVGGQLYSYDNGVASLTDMGMPFYHMHEGTTVHGRYNADGSWTTTRVDLPSWWGTVPDVGGSSWGYNSMGSWNANWMIDGHGGGGGGGGAGSGGGGNASAGIDRYGSGDAYQFRIYNSNGNLQGKIYGSEHGFMVLKTGTEKNFFNYYYNAPDMFFENDKMHKMLLDFYGDTYTNKNVNCYYNPNSRLIDNLYKGTNILFDFYMRPTFGPIIPSLFDNNYNINVFL